MSLAAHGLDSTLAKLAASQPVPVQIDDSHDLIEITGADATLRFTFRLRTVLDPILPEVLAELEHRQYADALFWTLMDAGATIERVFLDATDQEMGIVRTTAAVCAS